MTFSDIRVKVDNRKFTVRFDDAGQALLIKERKLKNEGHPYLECLIDVPYWHAKHHQIGGPKTLPVRIILAARERLNK